MFIATLDTEHYEFLAGGKSEEEAKQRVAIAFQKHLMQAHGVEDRLFVRVHWVQTVQFQGNVNTVASWTEALDEWYGIRAYQVNDKTMLRDGEAI